MELSIPDNLHLVIFDLNDTLMFKTCASNIDICSKDIIKCFKKAGVKIALCSLNKMARFYLYSNNVDHMFDDIQQNKFDDEYLNDEDKQNCKSCKKTYMYINILKKFNIKAENTIVFDDNWIHTIEAKKMNMKYILVDNKKCITWNNVKNAIGLFKHPNLKRCNSF